MADLANEGRGGAVGGQLAARERAAGGLGTTGPRGEHPEVRGACVLREGGPASPAAAPPLRSLRPGSSARPITPGSPSLTTVWLDGSGNCGGLRP